MQANVAHQEQRRQDSLLFVLAVALVVSQAFSDFLTRSALGIATLWPSNALLAAGLLVLSPRRRIILAVVAVLGHVAIDLMVGDSPDRVLLYTAVDIGESFLVWGVTKRFFGGPPRVRNMRQLALLTTLTAPVVLAMAVVCATVLTLAHGLPFVTVLTDWFLCGALGMAIVLPAVLVLLDSEHRRAFQRPLPEQIGLFLLVAVLTATVFYGRGLPAPFLLFPVALLVAFRLGPRGAAQASLIVACVAIPLTVQGLWTQQISTNWSQAQQNRLVQVFVGVLFVPSLATGLALAQQERLRRLRVRREQLTRASTCPRARAG